MTVRYTIVGKVGIRQVVGALPRIGETLVTFIDDPAPLAAKFKVIDVQHKLTRTDDMNYAEALIEVHIELID